MERGHIKVDQMRKRYDFKIKGAKVFAACNEIIRLSRPLQSRFRRLHLPLYTEEQFLEVSVKVLPKSKIAHIIGKAVWDQRGDIRDVISMGSLVRKNDGPEEVEHILSTMTNIPPVEVTETEFSVMYCRHDVQFVAYRWQIRHAEIKMAS
jgi:hypothetical protein